MELPVTLMYELGIPDGITTEKEALKKYLKLLAEVASTILVIAEMRHAVPTYFTLSDNKRKLMQSE